jgi:carboxyl-terminal processing protease
MTNRIRAVLISVSCLLVFYVVMGGLLGKSDVSSEKTYRDLGVYSEVLSRIKRDYVTEPDLKKVTDGSIRGLLEALDPYSTYLSPEEYQQYVEHPSPGPAAVGIFLSKRMGFATVVSVLPGSPAEKGGIKAGDLIDRIDNAGTREFSVVQLQRKLAGPPGSEVDVTIVREVRGEPQKIVLTRAVLNDPPVVSKTVENGAAYIRIATFDKGKAAEVAAKLKSLIASGANKVVLDLRNCAGGEFDEAVDTASLFMQDDLVGYVQGQRYPRQDLRTKPSAFVVKLPLAVLINQSTAGPAELLASAILNNKRGEVVGVRSFGVGVLQKAIPVGDGSALLLSVAKYYGPDGQVIHDNGVTPSVVQSADDGSGLDDDDELAEPEHFGGSDDLQLQKAIEVLTQKTTVAKAA